MIEAKKNNTFEEIDEIKHVEVFESDNQAIFKSDGENLKNYPHLRADDKRRVSRRQDWERGLEYRRFTFL